MSAWLWMMGKKKLLQLEGYFYTSLQQLLGIDEFLLNTSGYTSNDPGIPVCGCGRGAMDLHGGNVSYLKVKNCA